VSVALGIQHAMRMRCIMLFSVVCLALQYFSALSLTSSKIWGGGVSEDKMYFDLSTIFV